MYKLIGVLTLLQREIAGVREKAERMTLEGFNYDDANQMVDAIHDLLCGYLDVLMESYPGDDEAGV